MLQRSNCSSSGAVPSKLSRSGLEVAMQCCWCIVVNVRIGGLFIKIKIDRKLLRSFVLLTLWLSR